MNKQLFEEYAELKIKEKEIKARLDEINPEIKQEIQDAGIDKVEMERGSFLLTVKRNWKFSERVKTAEAQVDALKEEEKADGTATYEENAILMFKEKKV